MTLTHPRHTLPATLQGELCSRELWIREHTVVFIENLLLARGHPSHEVPVICKGNFIIAKNNSNCLSKNFVIRKFVIANLIFEALLLVCLILGTLFLWAFLLTNLLCRSLYGTLQPRPVDYGEEWRTPWGQLRIYTHFPAMKEVLPPTLWTPRQERRLAPPAPLVPSTHQLSHNLYHPFNLSTKYIWIYSIRTKKFRRHLNFCGFL